MLSDFWSDLRFRLRAVFRRAVLERELDDEVGFHLDQEAAKLERAGHSPTEARRLARVAFGGVQVAREESRDARGISWLHATGQDLRYAFRGLRASPGFTTAVIGTLALGIGANAAMFSIVDQLLFRPPAFLRDPDRVHRVFLETQQRGRAVASSNIEFTRFQDLTRATSSFSRTAAVFHGQLAVGRGSEAREMVVAAVSGTMWDFFDAPPALGRYFRPAEDSVPSGTAVAVLSHALWQSRFGGRTDVLGTQLPIGPVSYTIIGVAPRGFVGPQSGTPPAAFIPITSFAGHVEWATDPTDYYTTYHWSWLEMLVRRKDGITREAAAADLNQAFQASYLKVRGLDPELPPAEVARPRAIAAPVQAERGPNQSTVTKVAQWVSGVAMVVLLIACANVANLLLARALNRRREIGLRLALGVSRGRLFRQLLTESVLLATLGGAAGLLIAQGGGALLARLFLPDAIGTAAFDWRTVLFASGAALLAGLATGLAPILQARRADVVSTLKIGAREGSYRRSRARDALLLVQGALSVILLVGAGLFLRSLDRVRSLRLGYDADRVAFVNLRFRGESLDDSRRASLVRELYQSAKAAPDAETASLVMSIPFWLSRSTDLYVPGIDSVGRLGHFSLNAVSPEYFTMMGTRLLRGRGITVEDRAGAPSVMVVSDAMAKVLWPGDEPIGKCIRVEADTLPCTTVVGVAESIRRMSISDDNGFQYYLSAEQFRPHEASLMVRTRGRAREHVEAIRRHLQPEMPGESYLTVMPLEDVVAPQLRSWELGATMFLAFGGLAVLLAGIGLYSVVAYNVVQRRQELGLRIALGATAGDLLRLVVTEGLRFAMIGVGIGGAVAILAAPRLEPLLFHQPPRDPVVFGLVALLLAAVAGLASVVPAARAARVDPNVTLRTD